MIGPPGSGKGTQAKLIAQKYNYLHLSTGDLLRSLAQKINLSDNEKGAMDLMREGRMVPDKLIFALVFDLILEGLKEKKGVILDGAVRNVEQAQGFQKFFEEKKVTAEILALEVSLSDKDSFDRLAKRRICVDCGGIIPWLPSTKNLMVCPKCDGKLQIRQDDDEKIIKERIAKQGNEALAPIIDFYNKLGVLKKINGNQIIENVEKDIDNVLEYAN